MKKQTERHPGRTAGIIAVGVALAVLAGLAAAGSYMADVSVKRGSNSSASINNSLAVATDPAQRELEARAEATKAALRAQAESWRQTVVHDTLTLTSEDGLRLSALRFPRPEPDAHQWAVIMHGYHSNGLNHLDYAQTYYEHGYNVLLPDQRAHGESEGTWIGMGWLERRDVIGWVNAILAQDADARIALHGFSMGAATVMLACGEPDLPDAVVACIEDAGYSSDWDEMADKLRKIYHLPAFPVLHAASLMTWAKAGYRISQADCVPALRRNQTPMLFIHGEADDFNPYYMLDVVYQADACPHKERLSVPGARHVMAAYTAPELYWGAVWNFLAPRMAPPA